MVKVWIVAKSRPPAAIVVHGLSEDGQHIRLRQPDGSYLSAHTSFAVGQIWDLTFHPAPRRVAPHVEDVIVTRWQQLEPEPDLLSHLLARVKPWEGGPDKLFAGHLRSEMNKNKPFISERDPIAPISMGYWRPDVSLIKWHDADRRVCYRYYTPDKELLIHYSDLSNSPISMLPAHTLVHVAFSPWWTPGNKYAWDKSSQVERRCYLSIAGYYL
ncbi:hypothetical protein EPA93_29250 [Ktedonosporobacter rubrisoli]|uniref:Dual OB-containing domain-containing protein n=1 Tax=Ktedonosporobacter rubrisoli TaxID=2509675 RepID=A0A4P6JWK0_KTERU|nr:hypothetical protein [Ktedonosporobacter rubrisoli]QBD79845.1 hypothetical protein EPA93_29250 [Ktedonosporobacter rubrisoli]